MSSIDPTRNVLPGVEADIAASVTHSNAAGTAKSGAEFANAAARQQARGQLNKQLANRQLLSRQNNAPQARQADPQRRQDPQRAKDATREKEADRRDRQRDAAQADHPNAPAYTFNRVQHQHGGGGQGGQEGGHEGGEDQQQGQQQRQGGDEGQSRQDAPETDGLNVAAVGRVKSGFADAVGASAYADTMFMQRGQDYRAKLLRSGDMTIKPNPEAKQMHRLRMEERKQAALTITKDIRFKTKHYPDIAILGQQAINEAKVSNNMLRNFAKRGREWFRVLMTFRQPRAAIA